LRLEESEQIALTKMEFNPLRNPKEYIWDMYERLRIRDQLTATPDELVKSNDDAETKKQKAEALEMKDWLIRFFVLFIDPESPFAKIRDFKVRKDKSKEAIGDAKGRIPKKVNKEIESCGQVYQLIQSEFFKLVHDSDYVHWVSLRSIYETLTDRLRNPNIDSDEAVSIVKQIPSVKDNLEEIEKKLFSDSRILRQVADEKQRNMLTGYAERYARQFVLPVSN